MLRLFGSVVLGGLISPYACYGATDALTRSARFERLLALAASAPTNISSTFTIDQGDAGVVDLQLAARAYVVANFGGREGPAMGIENSSTNSFVLSALPANVESVLLRYGTFDLSGLGENPNVTCFVAECLGLNVDLPGICKRFPSVEILELRVFDLNQTDLGADSLLRLKSLRRLGLGHDGPLPRDFVRTLVSSMPHLETFEVLGSWNIGVYGKGWSKDEKPKRVKLSVSLAANDESVVEIHDLGACTVLDLYVSAPSIRFVDIKPPADSKKLHTLYLNLTNVIPSGEECLVENGTIRYRVRIEKCSNSESATRRRCQ